MHGEAGSAVAVRGRSRARALLPARGAPWRALAIAGAAAMLVCCESSPSGGGAGAASSGSSGGGGGGAGAGGGAPVGPFQPKGCDFQVAPRPEYGDVAWGRSEVAGDPKIRRVRLGLGGNVEHGAPGRADPATTAAFAWQTDDGTYASDVAWGTTPDPADWPAENRTSGLTWLTPPGAINANGEARMHEAYVCGLKPATTYYYRVGGGPPGAEVWSEVHAFTTTPSDPKTEVLLGVTGDSRGQENHAWRLLQRRFLDAGVTAQIFSGDMINFATDQKEWELWLDLAWKDDDGKLLGLGQILTLSAHGNHENHSSLFFANVVLPQDVTAHPKYGELFYSVDIGPVHVIVVDDAFVVQPQLDPEYAPRLTKWLRADLETAKARRAEVPWIVTVHHHAEYSSSNHGDDADVLRGREYFVPLWDEFDVDLAIAGHDHNYERSKPLSGPPYEPVVHDDFAKGTVYLVCAGAGADAYSAGTSAFTAVSRDYKSGGALGFYALVRATQKELKLEAHELRADGSDPVFDEITITK